MTEQEARKGAEDNDSKYKQYLSMAGHAPCPDVARSQQRCALHHKAIANWYREKLPECVV